MLSPDAMTHCYTEDQLVERPSMGLFAELDRTTGHAPLEILRTRVQPLPHPLSRRVNPGEDNG
jgi:hypothetical protein